MSELTYKSATELAAMVRAKEVSSSEVIDAHIARIEVVNPKLNAVAQLLADSARAAAADADVALAKGEAVGPLHGVPFTVKDAIQINGVISSGGTLGRKDYVAKEDAVVITRMRGAGAILLANTNVPELCLAGETDSLVYGRTNNPFDTARTPGGSSGGEAAIIAAGGSPLGLGSDVGGSIRQPAHYCGIAGIKPTTGRVPTTGHWPALDGLLGSLFQIGPMARTVEDLALTLPIIAGPDWRDPYAAPVPLGSPSAVDISALRIATFTDNGAAQADADTVAAVAAAAKVLTDVGAVVEADAPSAIGRGPDLMIAILRADAGAGVRGLLKESGTTELHPLMRSVLELQGDSPLSAADFGSLLAELDQWRGEMLSFMEGYDAILCPNTISAAVPHGGFSGSAWSTSTTSQFNLTGWPGAVVRAGQSGELPIGVQVVARPWQEDVALALAKHIETALGGWRPPIL
jgi:amidase